MTSVTIFDILDTPAMIASRFQQLKQKHQMLEDFDFHALKGCPLLTYWNRYRSTCIFINN